MPTPKILPLTRMGFATVRLGLLICVLMVGLPAWALVDWLTLPATQFRGTAPGARLLPAGPLPDPALLSYSLQARAHEAGALKAI